MAYTLTVKSYSSGEAVLTLTSTETLSTALRYRTKIFSDSAGATTISTSAWGTPGSGDTAIDFTFSNIPAGSYYAQAYSDAPADLTSIVVIELVDNTPKTATVSQWQDLANRVKAKSDVQITMTSTDPGEGAVLAADNYIAVYGGDPIILDYSTTEINTGAKWIDGSAIYKKTINFGTLPASGNRTVAHSISNLAYIVDIKAMAYDTGSSRYKALNLPQGNNTDWVVMEADSTNVYAYVGSDFSDTTAYVTLYYTKSSS